MKERVIKNSLLYIVALKQRLNHITLCWLLILPYQALFIILVSIQCVLPANGNQVSQILKSVWEKFNDTTACNLFLILEAAACILLCITFVVFVVLKKNLGELDEKSNLLNKLIGASAAVVILMEALLFNMTSCLMKIITNYITSELPQNRYGNLVYVIPFCFIAVIGIGIINHRIRIMGSFFKLFLILDQLNANFSFIHCALGIVINMYLIRNDENYKFLLIKDRNVRKILHLILIAFFTWKFINLLQVTQVMSAPDGYLTYIYLLMFMFLAVLIGVAKFVCKVNRRLPPVIQLCQCLQILAKDPEDMHCKLIALEIENQYIKNSQSGLDGQGDKKTCIDSWNTNQWQGLVQEMIRKQYQKYSSLESGIVMIKCRLMIKDKQIFDIIEFLKDLIQKNKHNNLAAMYEILKISLRIEEVYFKKHETSQYPIIQILRQVNQLNQLFYKDADKQMKKMHAFWETVIAKKLKIDSEQKEKQSGDFAKEIRKLTVEIYRGICHLEETVKRIELYSIAERQKKVLKSIKQICFQLNHQKENVNEGQSQKNNQPPLTHLSTQNDFLQYIEVVNQKITNISLKILSDLRYHKRQVVGQPLSFLIPPVYVQAIEQRLRIHDEPVYKFPYLIPVKCADQSVILKKLKTYLEIDSDSGYKIIFHFERTYSKKDPFIIYNTASNIIESYNRAFLEVYKLDSQKINAKIASNYLNPDQIFLDLDLHDKNIQTKLSENGFETEYNCRLQTAKITRKSNIIQSVRVSLIEKQKGFMILKIIKGYRMKSIGNQGTNELLTRSFTSENIEIIGKHTTTQEETGQFTKMKSPDQNQIFCKIENPYQTKISNKKLQITRPKKITLQFWAISLVCVGLVLFLFQGIVFISINYEIRKVIEDYNNNIGNQYKQYTVLMIAYEKYFEQTLIKLEKDRLVAMGMNYTKQLSIRQKDIEAKIDIFQKKYLTNILNANQQVLEYKIKFKYFEVVTDTTKTNLFDFSQNLLQFNSADSLFFLRANYPAFSNLILRVKDQASGISQNVNFFIMIYYIVSGVIFAIILTCLIISTLIRLKVCWICTDVEYILKLVNCSNLKRLFNDLEDVSKKIMENGQQEKQKYIKSQKLFKSSILIQHQKEAVLTSSRMQLNEQISDGQSLLRSQELQKQRMISEQKYEQSKKSQVKQMARNFGIFEYITFAIAITIAAVIQVQFFTTKINNDYAIINYKIESQKIMQNTIHQVLEVTNYFVNKNTHNDTSVDHQTFINKLTINDKYLPPQFFGQYTQYVFNKDLGDLCQVLNSIKTVSFDSNTCYEIGGGIFKFGLTKTIEYLNQVLYGAIYNQYWYSTSDFSNMSLVEQIQHIQQMITTLNTQNQQIFQSYHQEFNTKMEQQAVGIMLFQFSLGILLLFVVRKAKKFIYETSEVARGYFLLLPHKVLIQSQILDHIRKHDILNRISKI